MPLPSTAANCRFDLRRSHRLRCFRRLRRSLARERSASTRWRRRNRLAVRVSRLDERLETPKPILALVEIHAARRAITSLGIGDDACSIRGIDMIADGELATVPAQIQGAPVLCE